MQEFLDRRGDEYSEDEKATMLEVDARARKAYEAKLASAYYTSPKFAKDLSLAAGSVGIKMGIRQAMGLVFAEMWFSVKAEFEQTDLNSRFELGEFLRSMGNGLKKGFENAKEKYKDIFSRFFSGAVAGALASLTTTLCNIFFTTAKNVVRIIRQSYASLVEAAKVLFINPENYTFGERMRAVAKILATGASVVVGTLVSEMVGKTPLGHLSVIGDVVQSFCGAFVTGIMSCTLLYFLDRSDLVNKMVAFLDTLPSVEKDIDYFRRQTEFFEAYAAQLMKIDLAEFKREITVFVDAVGSICNAKTEAELNGVLSNLYDTIGIKKPWDGYMSFNAFMSDPNSRLVFE